MNESLKFKIGIKILTAFVAVAGGIALLFGLLFDLVFLTPLRVPMHQTPISMSCLRVGSSADFGSPFMVLSPNNEKIC